jgi:hypothetical protein
VKKYKNEIFIGLAGIVAYCISAANDFHTDDWYALRNYSVGLPWLESVLMDDPARFRPLKGVLIYLRYLAFGDNAWGYYVISILLHVVVCLLFYRFLLKIGLSNLLSFLSALFFTIYFQHYEAVLWLSGIIRIYVALFLILSLWMLHKYIRTGERRSLIAFGVISFAGLFVAEDFLVAQIAFVVFSFLFAERPDRRRHRISIVIIGGLGLIIYFALRTSLIGSPQFTQEYYKFGPHVIANLVGYLEWMALPPPDHSYFRPLSTHLGAASYRAWDIASMVLMVAFSLYSVFLIVKGPRGVRFFSVLIFVALIPALPLTMKVGSRYTYVPSLGFSVIVSYAIIQLYNHFRSRMVIRSVIVTGVAAYMILSVCAIWVTSRENRKTRLLVRGMINDIRGSGVNLSGYEFVFIDHMPGRTIAAPAIRYAFNYEGVIDQSYNPVRGALDIRRKVMEICTLGKPFVVFDYRDSHLMEATEDYACPKVVEGD